MSLQNIRIKLNSKPKKVNIDFGQVLCNIITKLVNNIQLTYYGIKLYK